MQFAKTIIVYVMLTGLLILQSGCPQPVVTPTDSENSTTGQSTGGDGNAATAEAEPRFVTVQHILIGFQGSVPGKEITRTKEEAEALAKQLLEQARLPVTNFGQLVSANTDDQYPGIYQIANHQVKAVEIPTGYMPRKKMVAAFGDVGFPLKINEVGLAEFDSVASPLGWHIIKRVE